MFSIGFLALSIFPPYQGRNLDDEEYAAVSDSMMELQVVLPEPAEYKDDVPLPMLSGPGQPSTPAQPTRTDADALRVDDWDKLNTMVGAA